MQTDEGVKYDKYGRMLYHPEFHPNHKKPYTEEELEYLCKFWDFDDRKTMSFALGRPETSISTKVTELMKQNKFLYYKHLSKHW